MGENDMLQLPYLFQRICTLLRLVLNDERAENRVANQLTLHRVVRYKPKGGKAETPETFQCRERRHQPLKESG